MVDDDARLMSRLRLRDPDAFEALYDRHHRLVYGIALRLMRHAAQAEDVTQAVFLNIWSAPHAFESGNFAAWIGRVTRNRCLDVLRADARHMSVELSRDYADDEAVEDAAFAQIDTAAVRHALGVIAAEQRVPIELAYFDGLTREGIAERTGVPVGTVKTRIRIGLQRLRQILTAAEWS